MPYDAIFSSKRVQIWLCLYMYIWLSQCQIYWACTQQLTSMSCMISLDILKLASDILVTVSVIWLESISSHILLHNWHCSSNTSDDVTSCRQHAPLISSSSGGATIVSGQRKDIECWRVTQNESLWCVKLPSHDYPISTNQPRVLLTEWQTVKQNLAE